MLNRLFSNPSVGFAQGVRASAYVILGCLFVANLTMKPRLPALKDRPAHLQVKPDVKSFFKEYVTCLLL